jgi:quercetin dioxygenase-like cupin family protein
MNTRPYRASDVETIDVLGLPHRVLVAAEDTPSGYEIIEISGPAGLGVPPHVHADEDETFVVTRGRVGFRAGDEEYAVTAGQAVNLPRGLPHAFTLLEEGTSMVLTIVPGNLAGMFRALAAWLRDLPTSAAWRRSAGATRSALSKFSPLFPHGFAHSFPLRNLGRTRGRFLFCGGAGGGPARAGRCP